MTILTDTLLARIRDNNRLAANPIEQAWRDGRIEAYEDILRLLGYFNDDDVHQVDSPVERLVALISEYDQPEPFDSAEEAANLLDEVVDQVRLIVGVA
jgi:hypothetical protein